MEENKTPVLDWLNLPEDVQVTSLWDSLHDSRLLAATSDLLKKSLSLEFDLPYIRNFNKLPEELRFLIALKGVQSVRINRSIPWPGEFSIPPDTSYEKRNHLVAIYQSKWREESDSWNTFEAKLASREIEVDLLNATLAQRGNQEFALKIGFLINDDSYHEVVIRSEGIEVFRSDGQPFNLEQLLEYGESYWTAFAQRRIDRGL